MDDSISRFKRDVEAATKRERIKIQRSDLKRSAVLVPIVFREDGPRLIVTKRTMTVATHKGQISFPGGVEEPCDINEIDTALRETEEEIGLSRSSVEVMGILDDFATTTGFAITPVVGIVDAKAPLNADPVEVEKLIEVPIAALNDPKNHELVTVENENSAYQYHRYEIGEHVIWGATAGMIHDFLTRISDVRL